VQQPHPLLKLAVLVSSSLLAVGFVAYQAGAFNGLLASNSHRTNIRMLIPTQDLRFLSSSKSQMPPVNGDFPGTDTSKWGPIVTKSWYLQVLPFVDQEPKAPDGAVSDRVGTPSTHPVSRSTGEARIVEILEMEAHESSVGTTSHPGVDAVKQSHPLLKLTVLLSSVLLAIGFIAYRAGAFNRFTAGRAPETETLDQTIMGGSKSKMPYVNASDFPEGAIMGGSKSDRILAIEGENNPSAPPPAPPQPSVQPK
jgi:hypothetical protein